MRKMRVEIYIIMYSKENPQLPQVKYQGKKILQVSPEHISPVRTWGRKKWHKIVTIQKYQIQYGGFKYNLALRILTFQTEDYCKV